MKVGGQVVGYFYSVTSEDGERDLDLIGRILKSDVVNIKEEETAVERG